MSLNINKLIIIKSFTFMMFFFLLFSCVSYSPIYWGFKEWSPYDLNFKNDSVAIFDWSSKPGIITLIDGETVGEGFKKAKLPSGKHVIEYTYYTAKFGTNPKGFIEIELKAGHKYELNLKLNFSSNPRRYSIWVIDKNIPREFVWGVLKGV
jgi:hypothetical protein